MATNTATAVRICATIIAATTCVLTTVMNGIILVGSSSVIMVTVAVAVVGIIDFTGGSAAARVVLGQGDEG